MDPVSFRDLQTLFPDLDGWEKAKPTGERMTAPFQFSQAEVRYRKGNSRLEIKIVDSGFNQLLFTPFTMFMQAGYEKETSSGYEKSTTVGGQPGWEKWNTEGKDGEVNAFVGKRLSSGPGPQRRRHQGAARYHRQARHGQARGNEIDRHERPE